MKFSIPMIAAALATACSASVVLPPGQQPLPGKFSLRFSSNSTLPWMTNKPPDLLIDISSTDRLMIADPGDIDGGSRTAVFDFDGDKIRMGSISFGVDISGAILLFSGTPRFPLQLGSFAQVNGIFAFNAGDGHGPPTTQWVACDDQTYIGVSDVTWNRPECIPIEVTIVTLV